MQHFLILTLKSPALLLAVVLLSFFVKTYLLKLLVPSGFQSLTLKQSWLFLLGTLIGTMFGDLAWIIKLVREMHIATISYGTLVFFIRISWAFLVLQYQSLALFLESLIVKQFRLKLHHKLLILLSCTVSFYFFYIAFFDMGLTQEATRNLSLMQPLMSLSVPLEIKMMSAIIYYSFFFLMLPSLFVTLQTARKTNLPIIVNHQLSILLKFLISSYLLVEVLQVANFVFNSFGSNLYPIVSVSTVILSYAIYYSIKKVLGIRFLNFEKHVQSKPNINLIHDFKDVLEQLSHVTSVQEVGQITQTFFKDTFDIPSRKAQLYLRMHHQEDTSTPFSLSHKTESLVETFLSTHSQAIADYIKQSKILIYDELDFSNFYQEEADRTVLLSFLEQLNADIFLPIYDKGRITAYIIVERHMRKRELYGNIERDEMIVFASYLCNIINLLQNRNFKMIIKQEKELRQELYHKHQEIKQYKESMRSFLSTKQQKKIGIIFYKNRRFSYGNQAAKELVGINLNTQMGHPIAKTCKLIVDQVAEYKSPQTSFAHDEKGNKLVLSAVPNLEQNNVIITVHYPEISDIITKQLNLLQDPTK